MSREKSGWPNGECQETPVTKLPRGEKKIKTKSLGKDAIVGEVQSYNMLHTG